MTNVWGIHNDQLSDELVSEGFVSIGWDQLGDLRDVGFDRERLREALADAYPDKKPRAIAGWAGNLLRFTAEIQEGDVIVAPYRADSTINLGVVTGPYEFHPQAPTHRHRRSVRWEKLSVPRAVFTQPALYEIGSLLAVFGVRKHPDEFLAAISASPGRDLESAVDEAAHASGTTLATEDEPRASRIERHTRDFVLERLKEDLSPQDFEEFTADLLRGMGYQARVTSYSQDGGVDVIAHRDPLGVEPPLIKVQCKQMTSTIGAPEVRQLAGTLGSEELCVFVTLGAYSREARSFERERQKVRLIGGEDLVDLFLRHYAEIAPRWRLRIPLTTVLTVDDSADL